MAQAEKGNKIHRINKHDDNNYIFNDPDIKKALDIRNKQLMEVFEACGYIINNVKQDHGSILDIQFGKHFNIRALSSDSYIIVIDMYDYKSSKIKVQLATDTDLKINKIKPKIELLMNSVMARLSGFVVRKEHEERNKTLAETILKNIEDTEKEKGIFYIHHDGKVHSTLVVGYREEIDELDRGNNPYKEDDKNKRNIGVQLIIDLDRYLTENEGYKIKEIKIKMYIHGTHICLSDYVDVLGDHNIGGVYSEFMGEGQKRISQLLDKATTMKSIVGETIQEVDGFVIGGPTTITLEKNGK